MRFGFVTSGSPIRRARFWQPDSPLVRDARYALVLQIVGLLFGTLSSFLDPLAGALVFGSLVIVTSMWAIYSLYIRERAGAPYEVLEQDQVYDLYDPDGQEAVHRRRFKIRFLQNDVIAIREYIWGDGPHIARNYTCRPGRIVDIHRYGPYWQALIALDEVKNRGDAGEYCSSRQLIGSFTSENEWVSLLIKHRTEKAAITVIMPEGRPANRWFLTTDFGTTEIPHGVEEAYTQNRQHLVVRLNRPPVNQNFTLRWEW